MALSRKLRNLGIAAAGPIGWGVAGLVDMKKSTDKVNKAYKDSVNELNDITKANTGEAGNQKAQMMANQGAMAAGNVAGQASADAAKSVGMNSEAADAIGGNINNNVTQDSFNNEYNKALEANRAEIGEAEQRVNEANEKRAQKGAANSKLLGTVGSLGGGLLGAAIGGPVGATIGAGIGGAGGSYMGSAISDGNAKNKWLLDSLGKCGHGHESKVKNKRLLDRDYDDVKKEKE